MTKDRPSDARSASEVILYQTEDGTTRLSVRLEGETVWLTQAAMAELFQTTPQNVTIHVKSIYEDGELEPEATCKDYLQVRSEGARQVQRRLKHYNLDMVIAVGYRVRSHRGTQFRRWATERLRAEFQAWANAVAERFGYAVRLARVGPADTEAVSLTQMAVFKP